MTAGLLGRTAQQGIDNSGPCVDFGTLQRSLAQHGMQHQGHSKYLVSGVLQAHTAGDMAPAEILLHVPALARRREEKGKGIMQPQHTAVLVEPDEAASSSSAGTLHIRPHRLPSGALAAQLAFSTWKCVVEGGIPP